MTSISRQNAFHRRVGHVSSVTGSVSNFGDALPFDNDSLSPLGVTSSRHRPRANSLHYQYSQFDITSSSSAIPDFWISSSASSLSGHQHHRTNSVSSTTSNRSRRPLTADHSITSNQSSPVSPNHVIRSPTGANKMNMPGVCNGSDDIKSDSKEVDRLQYVPSSPNSASVDLSLLNTEGSSYGELERRLAEREDELRNLRQTMERNELAIMKVVEEQRKQLTSERKKELESTLQRVTRDSERLRRENKYLRTMLRATREQLETTRDRLDMFKSTLPNSSNDSMQLLSVRIPEEEMTSTSSPLTTSSRSSSTLHDAFSDNRVDELSVNNVESNENLSNKIGLFPSIVHRSTETPRETGSTSSAHSDYGDSCRRCFALGVEVVRQRDEFDRERSQWIHEKRLVIEYQKLLQVGLVRFMNRCRLLEKQLLLTDSLVDDEDADGGQLSDGVRETGSLKESDC